MVLRRSTDEQVLVELTAKRARVATTQELRLRICGQRAEIRIVPITSVLHAPTFVS
jgi:hypothetical protein